MKILTVAYLHGAGGAERQIILLSNEMAKRFHDVHMIILNEFKNSYCISDKVTIHDLSYSESKIGNKIINRYLVFKEEVKKIKPDVTINYNLQGAYFSLLAGRTNVGKIVYSERGDPYDKEYSGLLGVVRDVTCSKVNALVFQSEGAKDFFRIRKHQKSIVIHNSVTVSQEKYLVPKKRDNRIVTVGRLHPQKNPHMLIDAFAKVASLHPEVSLDFYGDGSMRDELQSKINNLSLQYRIHLNPSRKDIFDSIRTARLFVLSSDYEGMPNALMEAMSLGLPCISTDCRPGGARTLIDDGINGYITPIRDVDALSAKISYMLDNPDLAEKVGKEARKIGLTHTNEKIFAKWEIFLKRLCL